MKDFRVISYSLRTIHLNSHEKLLLFRNSAFQMCIKPFDLILKIYWLIKTRDTENEQ